MTFAQRKPLPQPGAGQLIFAGREREIGLYRLHVHRAKDNPEVRLITAISGPGGVGKSRLLDELERYRAAETIYGRLDERAGIGHDATGLLRAIADRLHLAGEPIRTVHFDQLFEKRKALLDKALSQSQDPKQLLRHYYRPVLLGLTEFGWAHEPREPAVDPVQFADLDWEEADLALAFENPIGLMTEALIADLNDAGRPNQDRARGRPMAGDSEGDGEHQERVSPAKQEINPLASISAGSGPNSVDSFTQIVLMFDDYEQLHPVVGEWLLTYLLGFGQAAIECDLRLVIAGRDDILASDERWQRHWVDHILSLPLEPFSNAELEDFVKKNYGSGQQPISSDSRVPSPARSYGAPLPLTLSVAHASGRPLPAKTEPLFEQSALFPNPQQGWLEKAALAGAFDQQRLLTLLGSQDGHAAFKWLVGQQQLVRAGGLAGQFRLDKNLAELLLRQAEGDLTADRRRLLGYLDQEITASREKLRTSTTYQAQVEHQALVLERLRHSLTDQSGPDVDKFVQAAFLEALDQSPPMMFTILGVLAGPKEGRHGIGIADDQAAPSEISPNRTTDEPEEFERKDTSSNLSALIASLRSLAEAWLLGRWEQMQAVLSPFATDETLSDEQRALAYNWWGYCHRMVGNPAQAIETYTQGLALYAEYAPLHIDRGLTQFLLKHYDEAIDDLSRALNLENSITDTQRGVIFSARGQAYFQLSNYAEALEDYSQAIRLTPDQGMLFRNRGLVYARQEDYGRAIEDYERAIQLNRNDAVAYLYRGLAQAAQNMPVQALQDYERAVELRPSYAEAFQQRGLAQMQRGELDLAVADFDRAIELNPQEAANFHHRGLAYVEQGQFEAALADFDQAISLDPDAEMTFYWRGCVYADYSPPGSSHKKRYTRALKDFSRALSLNPENAGASYRRGLTYVALQDYPRAIDDLNQALSLELDRSARIDALQHRGLAYLGQQAYPQAVADYSQVLKLAPRNFEALFRRGLAYSLQGDFDQAIADFDEAIALNPESAEVFYRRGQAYAGQHEYGHAVEDYNRALLLKPQDPEIVYDKGVAYAQAGQLVEAIESFNLTLRLDSDNAAAFYQRGQVFVMLENDYQRAIDDFTQAIRLNPENSDYFYQRGLTYIYQQDIGRAIDDFRQAIILNPKEAEMFHNLGLALARQGDYEEALENYDRAVRLVPDHVELLQNRGLTHAALHNYEQAVADFSRALDLAPNAATYNYRGSVYANNREYRQAVEDFSQAIALNSGDAAFYHNRGVVYMRQGALKEAIEDFRRAMRLDPENPTIYVNCGNAFFKQGDYVQAIEGYNQALRRDADNGATLKNRGLAYGKLGNLEQAIKDYSRAIRLDPSDVTAYNYRGGAYEAIENYEQALSDYDRALSYEPDNVTVLSNRALVYYALGDYERALSDFNNIVRLEPLDATTFHNRGLTYYNLHNYPSALKDFDQAIRLNPDDSDAIYRKACLLALLGQDDASVTWLAQAIEMDSAKRQLARDNPDFEGLWYKPAFRKLFGYK